MHLPKRSKLLAAALLSLCMLEVFSQPVALAYSLPDSSTESQMISDTLSLVGKVRYVWGGGHLKTAMVDGISPIWEPFNQLYADQQLPSDYSLGLDRNSWCPVHGYQNCIEVGSGIHSLEQLIDQRADMLGIPTEQFSCFSQQDFKDRSTWKRTHRFDGLDCSGYMSWVVYQSLGVYQESMEHMDLTPFCQMVTRDSLRPGDIVEFDEHTYMLIGEVQPGCWIHSEATPGVLRLGITWWGQGKWAIDEAYQIILRYYEKNDLMIQDNVRVFDLDSLPVSEYKEGMLSIGRVMNIEQDILDISAVSVLGLWN